MTLVSTFKFRGERKTTPKKCTTNGEIPAVPPRPRKKQPSPPVPSLPKKCHAIIVNEASDDIPGKCLHYSTNFGKSSAESTYRSVTPMSVGDHPSDSNSAATVIGAITACDQRPDAAKQQNSPRLIDAKATASVNIDHEKQFSTSTFTSHAFTESKVPYSRHSQHFYENEGFQTDLNNGASTSANASAVITGGHNSSTTVSASASATVTSMGSNCVYEPALWDLSARQDTATDITMNRLPRDRCVANCMQPLALMETGAMLSIASQLSSDIYTDDELGIRDPLNYSTDNMHESCDPINRPDPALGHYRDSLASQDNSSIDAPPDLLSSSTIHSRLRLLLKRTGAKADSEVSSDADLYGSVNGSENWTDEIECISSMKKQISGLEKMYREVLMVLGVDKNHISSNNQIKELEAMKSSSPIRSTNQNQLPSRRRLRHLGQRNNSEIKTANKRIERLESHVVTLAQCISEISSDIHQIRLQDSAQGSAHGSSTRTAQASDTVTADCGNVDSQNALNASMRNMKLCLSEPKRLTKLKWFFGVEPPFIKEFLEHLGYEKYNRRFENEQIGLMEMNFMTEDRLRTLGVPLGPRLRILEEMQNLFCPKNSNVYALEPSSCLV